MSNLKYKKIDLSGLDLEIDPDLARAFIDHRITTVKKPLTQYAFDQQMKIALKAFEIKMTPNEVIDYVCTNTTWQGINLSYIANKMAGEARAKNEAMDSVAEIHIQTMKPGERYSNNGFFPDYIKERPSVDTRSISTDKMLNDTTWADE